MKYLVIFKFSVVCCLLYTSFSFPIITIPVEIYTFEESFPRVLPFRIHQDTRSLRTPNIL